MHKLRPKRYTGAANEGPVFGLCLRNDLTKDSLANNFLSFTEGGNKKADWLGERLALATVCLMLDFVCVCMCVCRVAPVLQEHWLSLCVKGGIRSPLAPGETLLRRPNPPKQAEKLVNTAAVADTQTLAISERSLSLSLSFCAGSGGSD